MMRKGWYMIAYDISDQKRLSSIHRIMKKNGIAAQKSLFFVQKTEKEIKNLLNILEKEINKKKDDIRVYPVKSPDKIWTTGGVFESFPLVMDKKISKKKKGLLNFLFGK